MNEVLLAQSLIQFPTLTPMGKDCLFFIKNILEEWGFTCHLLSLQGVDNLYARIGTHSPHLCFAGHVDVVEPSEGWDHPPFDGVLENNSLYGRGAVDMKGAIAAFMTAFRESSLKTGSVSLLLTSDEEGPALFGTKHVVEWLTERGEIIDVALVGEPTSIKAVGDCIKIGRRGSLCGKLTVQGKTGHVAYPHFAKNPIPALMRYLSRILYYPLDAGCEGFEPSNIEVTFLETNTSSFNVIPSIAKAYINIRFNPLHTGAQLQKWLNKVKDELCLVYTSYVWDLDLQITAEPFFTKDEILCAMLQEAVQDITKKNACLSTGGGTSDARFLKEICPVIELGLLSHQAHQVNEHVSAQDLHTLKEIYKNFINKFSISNPS